MPRLLGGRRTLLVLLEGIVTAYHLDEVGDESVRLDGEGYIRVCAVLTTDGEGIP